MSGGFADLLERRSRPIVTAEFPPLNGGNLDLVTQMLMPMRGCVDAVNVTDNPAAHAHASSVAVAIAVKQAGVEPIMQVVCRDRNRLALQADAVGATMHGVVNVCALTGDDVTAGDEPEARRVFDLDGLQLVSVLAGLSAGKYLSGRAVTLAKPLTIGAVENPYAPPCEIHARRAWSKVQAGARFLQLQIGFQPRVLASFMAECRELGVTDSAAVLPSVIAVKSARALRYMDENVPGIHVPGDIIDEVSGSKDQAQSCYDLAVRQAREALALPGVAGIHLIDFRRDGAVQRLTSDLAIGPAHSQVAA